MLSYISAANIITVYVDPIMYASRPTAGYSTLYYTIVVYVRVPPPQREYSTYIVCMIGYGTGYGYP